MLSIVPLSRCASALQSNLSWRLSQTLNKPCKVLFVLENAQIEFNCVFVLSPFEFSSSSEITARHELLSCIYFHSGLFF